MVAALVLSVPPVERRRIRVTGIVQGVGFRPFVYNLAQAYALGGCVLNDATGVLVEVEGAPAALDAFIATLQKQPPPMARIAEWRSERILPQGERSFRIAPSVPDTQRQVWVSADQSLCDECLRELFDPANRRYGYPFINCTQCGPRFTIIRDLPYDRPLTSMAGFRMCDACQREYDDPHDRRFHTQPNACPVCGPTVYWHLRDAGAEVCGAVAIGQAAQALCAGRIIAIKGLGGYHLACDATNEEVVDRLRRLKQREAKPFALMVRDAGTAQSLCAIGDVELQQLTARQRPIVLLRARPANGIAMPVAPRHNVLGVMLPYTPLHHLLLERFAAAGGQALVMTSGNRHDEPMAYTDEDARQRLGDIADGFLTHDRPVHVRCDDSVLHIVNNTVMPLRRARGYAPEPLRVPTPFGMPVLATGAHLKNTFCLGKGEYVWVSQHIGDLENAETLQAYEQAIAHYQHLFDIKPRVIAHDLHPNYLATQYALNRQDGAQLIGVQHHHAHIASVMGEHGLREPVIGVAFDGTGYGTDGTLWGGEFLVADYARYERVAYVETLPLLGGAQAIREVWRLAAAWLAEVFGPAFIELDLGIVRGLDRQRWRVLEQMRQRAINAPRTSSMGRYFDAVAALCGVRSQVSYEGQAAIELEMLADASCRDEYPFRLTAAMPRLVQLVPALYALVDDLTQGVTVPVIAARFHNTVAALTAQVCAQVRDASGLNIVVLGGGVFQNALLLSRTQQALTRHGFNVCTARQLPPNDGGLSFGQALIANAIARQS